jgi:hypothetical protein
MFRRSLIPSITIPRRGRTSCLTEDPLKMKFSQFALATACVLASANGFTPTKPTGFGMRQVRSNLFENWSVDNEKFLCRAESPLTTKRKCHRRKLEAMSMPLGRLVFKPWFWRRCGYWASFLIFSYGNVKGPFCWHIYLIVVLILYQSLFSDNVAWHHVVVLTVMLILMLVFP